MKHKAGAVRVETLTLTTALVSLAGAAMFAGAWYGIARRAHFLAFAAAYALGGLALVVVVTGGENGPGSWSVSGAGNTLFLVAAAVAAHAVHLRAGTPSPRWFLATVVVLAATANIVGLLLDAPLARLSSTYLAIGTLFATPVVVMRAQLLSDDEDIWDRVILAVIALCALFFLLNPRAIGPFLGLGAELVFSDTWWTVLNVAYVVVALALTSAVIAAGTRDVLDALDRKALTDPLTGLLNREGLDRGFADMAGCFARGLPVSVVLADIDHFKRVNDTHGHAAGDAVLKAFADLMRAADGHALVARLGGEEFVAVLPRADVAVARLYAEGLRTTLERMPIEGIEGPVTASFGVAGARGGGRGGTPLSHALGHALIAADVALYRAKEAGRNRVQVAGLKIAGSKTTGLGTAGLNVATDGPIERASRSSERAA